MAILKSFEAVLYSMKWCARVQSYDRYPLNSYRRVQKYFLELKFKGVGVADLEL
jgi:hypothetical protein